MNSLALRDTPPSVLELIPVLNEFMLKVSDGQSASRFNRSVVISSDCQSK